MRARWNERGYLVVDGFESEDLAGGCWGEVGWLRDHHVVIGTPDCLGPHRNEDIIMGVYEGGVDEYGEINIAGAQDVRYEEFYLSDYGTPAERLDAIADKLGEIFSEYGTPEDYPSRR